LNGNTRQLSTTDYEIVYEGLDGDDVAIDGNTIVKLDLELTPALEREGIAREISRFLNQMRKDADFSVDARVKMVYETNDTDLASLITEFAEFFKKEALLGSLEAGSPAGNIVSDFETDGKIVKISLEK
jgi:isoleucyl-tRNA synthetase